MADNQADNGVEDAKDDSDDEEDQGEGEDMEYDDGEGYGHPLTDMPSESDEVTVRHKFIKHDPTDEGVYLVPFLPPVVDTSLCSQLFPWVPFSLYSSAL